MNTWLELYGIFSSSLCLLLPFLICRSNIVTPCSRIHFIVWLSLLSCIFSLYCKWHRKTFSSESWRFFIIIIPGQRKTDNILASRRRNFTSKFNARTYRNTKRNQPITGCLTCFNLYVTGYMKNKMYLMSNLWNQYVLSFCFMIRYE